MIKLPFIKRKRVITPTSNIIYNNCDIPARLLFDEVFNGNLSVLGTGTDEELHKVYMAILDEYCELDENTSFIDAYQLEEQISTISKKMAALDVALNAIISTNFITREERLEIIDNLNKWTSPRVKFNIDAPLDDEVIRVKKKVMGALSNELNRLTSMRKKSNAKIKKTFYRDCAIIQTWLGFTIDANVSTKMFIEYSKIAAEKSKKTK